MGNNPETGISRRRFLQTSAAAAIGLALPWTIETPHAAMAGASTWPYDESSKYWFPLRESQGITLLNGLRKFDSDFNTHVTEYFSDYAHWSLEESPQAQKIKNGTILEDDRDTWGNCHAVRIAERELARLRALGEVSFDQASEIKQDPDKLAVLTAYCSSFVYKRPYLEAQKAPNNISFFLTKLDEENTGFISDIVTGKAGSWFHNIIAYDNVQQMVLGSGFGYTRWFPTASLRSPFIPEEVNEAVSNNTDPRLVRETASLRHPDLVKERVFEHVGLKG